ncbi:MAG: single-stranded-DNA-specific exonuclease RecJ [Phycisphaerae bacterium]|nr:single-stranded-DNA-specific exonuclease RecJ [Phycisphaerae bacterium]
MSHSAFPTPNEQSIRPIEVAAGGDRNSPPMRGLRSAWTLRNADTSSRPLIQRVLDARGISGPGFLQPSLKQLHEPSLMPGLEPAAARIFKAIRERQRIVIYADYDVDGVSAAAILWHMIRAIEPSAAVATYLPHRLEEGYGLNAEAIAKLCDNHDLIISVDCGVTAVGPARIAGERGVDLIITDHHTPPRDAGGLPPALAIVHPLVPGETPYPFPDLCGAGVAFKVAWRLATIASGAARVTPELQKVLIELLALAAMGVIADVVPLRGENRVLARFGLDQIKRSAMVGVRALRDESGLGGDEVDASDIGFRLGPRLNAIGRLGHAREALEMLTTADESRARQIAESLTGWNDERRRMEAKITEHAAGLAIGAGMTDGSRRAIVLCDQAWHRGVVGICCSRLVGLYHRPTILLQREGDLCHGSGRSIEGFDLHAALEACAEHLESFGGHAMAAGLKVRSDRLGAFEQAFVAYANERLSPDHLVPRRVVDAECVIGELNMAQAEALDSLAPFGRENARPLLLVRGATIASEPRALGKTGKHIRFDLKHGSSTLRVKAWNWTTDLVTSGTALRPGRAFDVLVSPEINNWNGRKSVEATLEDLRPSN